MPIIGVCSSLALSYQVSHPYKITSKLIVLCILIFKFVVPKLEGKVFCTEWWQAFPHFNLPLISSWIEFWFFMAVPKYLNCSTIWKKLLSKFILWLGPNWYSVQKLCSNLTVSSWPITNTCGLTPFTVTAELPFRVKDAQYLRVCLSPSEPRGIPVLLHDKRHNQSATRTNTHTHTHTELTSWLSLCTYERAFVCSGAY